MKRSFDLAAALAGLVLAAPAILVLVILIRRDTPGPGLFGQQRVGRRGRPFRCWKLRTMHADTPERPSHEIGTSQVTRVGAWLRRRKLDELPQLWNIVRGEMSFVGPRPCLPSQTALIEERERRGVFAVRPGITGLAQINDIDMSDPVRLAEIDADYVRRRSFAFDMAILIRTVFAGAGAGDRVRLDGNRQP
ncbi:MAG: sugar transferase [Rhizobiaceae bacterium]|nr:sugar transferase [Rhizobiaceae bacterium]MCV0405581.1 sugar transferase [Rhizobiaceae bacterium]